VGADCLEEGLLVFMDEVCEYFIKHLIDHRIAEIICSHLAHGLGYIQEDHSGRVALGDPRLRIDLRGKQLWVVPVPDEEFEYIIGFLDTLFIPAARPYSRKAMHQRFQKRYTISFARVCRLS
jgi:hypothetical protein